MKKITVIALIMILGITAHSQTVKDTTVVKTEQFQIIEEGMNRIIRNLAIAETRSAQNNPDSALMIVEQIKQQAQPIMVELVKQLAPQYLDTVIVDVEVDKYELLNELDIVDEAIFKWDNSLLVDKAIKQKRLSNYKAKKKKIESYLEQLK